MRVTAPGWAEGQNKADFFAAIDRMTEGGLTSLIVDFTKSIHTEGENVASYAAIPVSLDKKAWPLQGKEVECNFTRDKNGNHVVQSFDLVPNG